MYRLTIRVEFLIAGLGLLGLGFILKRLLDSRDSRWSNLALVICVVLGIVCIGIFGGL